MSDADTDLVFKGHTPGSISCEDFVRAVRKHANSAKKSRDDEYIADYVMGCLTDDALHWSETLSRDVQGDWSLLRRALLEEYGTSDRKQAYITSSLPGAIVPVPAAAPPLAQRSLFNTQLVTPQGFRGRVQVIASGTTRYLSDQTHDSQDSFYKGTCITTANVPNACVLLGTIGNEGIQFIFESTTSPSVGLHLGIVWGVASPLTARSTIAVMTTIQQGPNPTITNAAHWKGPVTWVTWSCLPDNTLALKLEGMPDAGIVIFNNLLVVASRIDEFLKANTAWNRVRLVFVPI